MPTGKGKTSVDEYRQVKEQESRKRLETELRVLQKELSFLLELFLRVPDLPGLHGRKSLGDDLQPHYLGMPGLRQDSFFLILSSITAHTVFPVSWQGLCMDLSGGSMEPESIETRLLRLEDREEIRELLIEYGRTLDRRDFEAFSKLFARDAEYTGGGGAGAVKGPEAIGKFLEEIFRNNPTGLNYPNFHLFSNTTIEVQGDKATALSKGAFVVRGSNDRPETVMLATYRDTLIREDGAWKFKQRVVEGDIPS
jgi:uncharacterized protein (TIGR02246 family)